MSFADFIDTLFVIVFLKRVCTRPIYLFGLVLYVRIVGRGKITFSFIVRIGGLSIGCFVFRFVCISWVLLGSVKDILFDWRNWFGKNSLNIWNLVPLCLMWILWRQRNKRTFEDMESTRD